MIRTIITAAVFAAALSVSSVTWMSEASAAIPCKGRYQVVRGDLIATPYCQDKLLVRVAQEYGMKLTFRKLRASFSSRISACRFVGHDHRVADICHSLRDRDKCTKLLIGC